MPDIAQASAELDSLIAEQPRDPFLHELKGQIMFENNRIIEALGAYRTAVSYLPDSALLLADLGRVELAQKPPAVAEATAHLEKSTVLDKDNAYVWRLLAVAYGKGGQNGMSALALAEEAMLQDDVDQALRQCEGAIKALPQGSPAALRARDLKSFALERQRVKKGEPAS
jgi:predicted Zn-dependent protease